MDSNADHGEFALSMKEYKNWRQARTARFVTKEEIAEDAAKSEAYVKEGARLGDSESKNLYATWIQSRPWLQKH